MMAQWFLVAASAPWSSEPSFRASQTAARSNASIAWSRLPRTELPAGMLNSAIPCFAVKPVSETTPSFLGPFTRRMLAASSGSASRYQPLRMRDDEPSQRTLIVDADKRRLRAATGTQNDGFVESEPGLRAIPAMKSSIANRYERSIRRSESIQDSSFGVIQIGGVEALVLASSTMVLPHRSAPPNRRPQCDVKARYR